METLIVIAPVVVDFLFPDNEKGKKRKHNESHGRI